jgi:ABC-type oligopeptide transport system substrate-binding subunit
MRKRLMLAASLAVVAASLLVSAAFAGSNASKAGGTLRVNHSTSDYEYIDPQKCYDTGCSEALWPTGYNLMQYPEKNGAEGKRVYPEAASGFKVSKDGKTYTFAVRPGQKASNGKVVTPAWFVRSFERLLSPKMGDAASARFGAVSIVGPVVIGTQEFYDGKADKIAGLSVKGNNLIIKLKKPFPSLTSVLAMNWFSAVDPAMPYSEQDVTKLVAAGPYFIAAREIGRNVVLDRNPNYKGKRPRNAERIVITVGGDENQSVLQVKAAQADYEGVVPASAAAALGDEFNVNKSQFFVKPTASTSYWGLNTLPGSVFANVNLRKAVNWAIDRPAQVRVSGKYAGRRSSQILPPAMPGFIEANNLYAYKGSNIAKAKALAGNVSAAPTVRILHRNSASSVNRGQIMRYNLEQIGLKAKTESIPFSQLLGRAGSKKSGDYDMIALGWQADYPDPENFINVLLDGRQIPDDGTSNNLAFFNSAKFNALMDKAALTSGDARYKLYGNLDLQIMKDAAPWAPYINGNNRILVSKRVVNSLVYNEATTNSAYNAFVIK